MMSQYLDLIFGLLTNYRFCGLKQHGFVVCVRLIVIIVIYASQIIGDHYVVYVNMHWWTHSRI